MLPARMKVERILCPVDFSDFSERALERAVRIAGWFEAEITVVHVIPANHWILPADAGVPSVMVPADLLRVQRQETAEELERFVAPFRGQGVRVHTRLLDGDPSREIEAAAAVLPGDLLVMGTHGRGGFEHLLLGSVTEKLLRRATCPVLTVGNTPARAAGPPFPRILCALDLTEASSRTLQVAMSLAEENMARVTILHVLEGPLGERKPSRHALPQVSRLREDLRKEAEEQLHESLPATARDFCSVDERVEEGVPWREVLQVARDVDAELIVMGAHSCGGLDRMFFGSTANQVVRRAACPVLVVREMQALRPVYDEAAFVGVAVRPAAAGRSRERSRSCPPRQRTCRFDSA